MQETDFSDKPDFLEKRAQPGGPARGRARRRPPVADGGGRDGRPPDGRAQGSRTRPSNTLVVFTSDNGFMLGEHGGVVGKDLPYPAATRIPLLVRWPGHSGARRTNAKLVANIDVAATLLDAAGVAQRDRRPVAARARPALGAASSRAAARYSEDRAPRLPAFRSLRTADYRYAEYYRNRTYDLIFREYYDLRDGPLGAREPGRHALRRAGRRALRPRHGVQHLQGQGVSVMRRNYNQYVPSITDDPLSPSHAEHSQATAQARRTGGVGRARPAAG